MTTEIDKHAPGLVRRAARTLATATDPNAAPRARRLATAKTVGAASLVVVGTGALADIIAREPGLLTALTSIYAVPCEIGVGAVAVIGIGGVALNKVFEDDGPGEPDNQLARVIHRIGNATGIGAATALVATGAAIAGGVTGVVPHDGGLIAVTGGIASGLVGITGGAKLAGQFWGRGQRPARHLGE